MDSYGFADGHGNEIARGYQDTLENARRYAQRQANARRDVVEMWVEGDVADEDGEHVPSLETFEPEAV